MNLILKNEIKKDIESVNKTLSLIMRPKCNLTNDVYKQVIGSGKRLRPLIVLYTALALGYKDINAALRVGSIVELIHTASLLHDDIIDEALTRRGNPTAHKVFGTKSAVLGGDYLYSLAFNEVLSFDARIADTISKAAYLLTEGELQELENAFNPSLSEDDYYDIIYKKTSVLIEASSISGAVLGDDKYIEAFKEYGKNLGFAFQIKDDCLDYDSDIETLGKDVGSDLKEGKITLPVLYAQNNDNNLSGMIKAYFDKQDDLLYEKIDRSVKENGVATAIKKAEEFSEKAKCAIEFLPKSKYKKYLTAIADYSIERKR